MVKIQAAKVRARAYTLDKHDGGYADIKRGGRTVGRVTRSHLIHKDTPFLAHIYVYGVPFGKGPSLEVQERAKSMQAAFKAIVERATVTAEAIDTLKATSRHGVVETVNS